MDFTNDFFIQAQGCIERFFRAQRHRVQDLYGQIDEELKADHTVVTELDRQLEQELREELSKFDAKIGFEGEEFGIEGNRDTYWLIDPIDGTENFIRGLPFVRNIVTLVDNEKPVFALVYKPISDELYVAAEGEGTYRNGVPVKVSSRSLDRAWIELSTWLPKPDAADVAIALNKKINGFRTTGEFLYVVEGKLDGLVGYKTGGGPWDYAPRALMIQEAGGKVANIGSSRYDFRNNDFVMANPVIFDDLMKIITETIDKN